MSSKLSLKFNHQEPEKKHVNRSEYELDKSGYQISMCFIIGR